MKGPLVRVVSVRDYTSANARVGEGSRVHLLLCGHEVRAKQSAGYQVRKHCVECGVLTDSQTPTAITETP
jgi:hypothetical protein